MAHALRLPWGMAGKRTWTVMGEGLQVLPLLPEFTTVWVKSGTAGRAKPGSRLDEGLRVLLREVLFSLDPEASCFKTQY